jgi:hypothetical protein
LAAFEEGWKKEAAEAATARLDEDGTAQKSDEARALTDQVAILQGRVRELSSTKVVEDDARSTQLATPKMDEVQTRQDETALPAVIQAQTLALLTQMVNQISRSSIREGSWENDDERELKRAVEPVPQPNGRYVLGWSPHRAGSLNVRGFTYRNTLSEVAVCLAGDGKFPALCRRWLRLLNDAPILAEDARVLMAYGFKEAASEEFEEILANHDDASSEELWTLLEAKLFNAD